MIAFANAQGSTEVRLACSKVLSLIFLKADSKKHSNGYVKGNKYFFFYKIR